MRYRLSVLATFILMLPAFISAAPADNPTTKPDTRPAAAEVPWSKPVDGLAMRIIVPKDVLVGEPIPVTIEVKNVSDRKRYAVELDRACDLYLPRGDHAKMVYVDYGALTISDPQGANKTGMAESWSREAPPESFKPIEPKEIKRAVVDLHDLIVRFGLARVSGEYRLGFKFTSPKPEKVIVLRSGALSKLHEPTKEQVAGAWVGTIESSATIRLRDLAPNNLTVHEWGVFSTFNDAAYANADLKAEWESMPSFFYRQFPKQHLKMVFDSREASEAKSEARKPIIYLYTDRPKLNVWVKVSFSQGAPVVWWPCASSPVWCFPADRGGPSLAFFRSIKWSGDLIGDPSVAPSPIKILQEGSWINQARIDGPATFTTDAGFPLLNGRINNAVGRLSESERFIYYDGLVSATDYVRCTEVAADSVTLENSAKFVIANLILVDRRDVKAIRFARVGKIGAGEKIRVALKDVSADWPVGITKVFGQDLRNAGLFDNEADSVLKIWEKGLFDRPGITAIYLLPQSEYDRMLPLTVSPKPGKVVRVGIVQHGQLELTPAIMAARVKELIVKMDNDDYRVRDKAAADLAAIGPASFGAIRKVMAGKISPEVKARLEKVLTQEGAGYLKP